MQPTLDKIVSLCKRRGFIFPSSEIYGGLANVYDFGPYGVALKNNIRDSWWSHFVNKREDIVGIESQILMHPKVWEASGHVSSFADPLVEDTVSKKRYRADHLIEAYAKKKGIEVDPDSMSLDEIDSFIRENKILSPDGNALSGAKSFNLLFETQLGVITGEKNTAYLRAETAQGMFVMFKSILESTRVKIPFGIAQIGKVFRNEVTLGKFIFRTLEFEQMEIQYFIREADWEKFFALWENAMEVWYIDILGLKREKIDWKAHTKLAHYAKKAQDLRYAFDWGLDEISGLHYRTDFDLSTHAKYSGKKLEITDNSTGETFVPHDVEATFGLSRSVLAVLYEAYHEETLENGSERVVMKFPSHLAPIQVAVFPLQKDDKLVELAREIYGQLLNLGLRVEFDNAGNIGKMYRRQDEIGTPFCVTVDFDSLNDQMVTIRSRDKMTQERIAIKDVSTYLTKGNGK